MALEEHLKGWGKELWIANTPLYCGKKMIIYKGKRCSLHYHKLKDETFYFEKGLVQLEYGLLDGERNSIIMKPGDTFHAPPLTVHRFTGLEYSEFFEFSTQHFDSDTYRIQAGD